MEDPQVSDPHAVAEALAPLLRLVHASLDLGFQHVREHMAHFGETAVDVALAPALIRHRAKRHLTEAQSTFGDYACRDIPNNGLYLALDRWEIRILKADGGDLPVPGGSRAKREYYYQPFLANERWMLFPELSPERVKLVVLWDVGPNYSFTGITLVCPKDGRLTRASVEAYWYLPIADPVTSIRQGVPVFDASLGLDEQDLDIRLLDSQDDAIQQAG